MRVLAIAIILCGLLSCAERNSIRTIEVVIKSNDKEVAKLSVYESGGKDFAVIDKNSIALVECPSPEDTSDGKIVYKGFTVEILTKKDGKIAQVSSPQALLTVEKISQLVVVINFKPL